MSERHVSSNLESFSSKASELGSKIVMLLIPPVIVEFMHRVREL